MIPIAPGVRVWLATGHTDLRKGFASLSLQVQEVLRQDPLGGHRRAIRSARDAGVWSIMPGRHGASGSARAAATSSASPPERSLLTAR